jgi:TRAP-type mannitol/chloroaromatic compound transport system permease small subunit
MKALKLYIRAVDRISHFFGMAMGVLVPVMMLVITYEVVVRYFLRKPTVWAFDTAIFCFGYIGLLAGAYALKNRAHINVDLFHSRLSERGKAILDSVTAPLIFFFLVLVIIYGGEYAADAFKHSIRRPTEWGPPLGHFILMIPVGAFLLLLQAIANWVRDLHLAITNRVLDV